jgi:hypothetical protein
MVWAAVVGTAVALPTPAVAHGGIPRAYEVYFQPDDSSRITLRSDNWGFFRSDDSGASWTWSCSEVYGDRSTDTQRHGFAMLPGGGILVAAGFKGLARASADGCSWEKVGAIPMGEIVVDVELDPHDGALWVMTTGASITRLWKSTDLGETFELASTVAEHYSANNLLVDPETPGVLLIGGHDNEDQANIRGEVLTSLEPGVSHRAGRRTILRRRDERNRSADRPASRWRAVLDGGLGG